ncbi:MAG TPA: hypothetical protein VFJ97_02955 [Dermatophilaceae bacterium]|nr:hypothetical protein [Dermatophilaceae bacterium]
MRRGLQVPSFTFAAGPREIGPLLARVARTAEDAGVASLWVMDQAIVNMPGVDAPEALELLPALVSQLQPIVPAGR